MASALLRASLSAVSRSGSAPRCSPLQSLHSAKLALSKVQPRRLCIRASAGEDNSSTPAAPLQTPPDFGLGGPGTWFGFGRSQELNVGRLAMIGFASALVMEVVTGKGVLGQLGLNPMTVRYPFLIGFAFLLVGGLLGGYVVVNNPPDFSKAPPNLGAGVPRNPFDKDELDRLPTYTRGGITKRENGQMGREPYVSDLTEKK